MWYDVSTAEPPQPASSLTLLRLYEVRADASYDVRPAWSLTSPFVAVRTLKGSGIIDSGRISPFEVTSGTLLILPWKKIRRFHCPGREWHFWWFEFQPVSSLPLPDQLLIQFAVTRRELADMRTCFSDLRLNGAPFQALASSRFTLLMHDWSARWSGEPSPLTRHQAVIQRVLELMHTRLKTRLSLSEMARAAGMGERRFRQVFTQLTGKSPKRFHEELRLRKAADHLRFHLGNVSEIADEFGYSSPFHFSKAFRHFFGVPPFRYLNKPS